MSDDSYRAPVADDGEDRRHRSGGRSSRSRHHHRSSHSRGSKRSRSPYSRSPSPRDRRRRRTRRRRSRSPSHSPSRSRSRDRGRRHRSSRSSRRSSRSPSRSKSPPVRRRRKKRSGLWDKAPAGFDGMNVAQVAQLNPSILAPPLMGMMRPGMPGGGGGGLPQQSRQAKRLYIGNVPRTASESAMLHLFNDAMIKINQGGEPPVAECSVNNEKCFAFLEFHRAEDATKCMALDGITIDGHSLKVRRPKDYNPAMSAGHAPPPIHVPGIVSTNVPDTPNKLFIGGLPTNLNEDQVKELLQAFGPLRAFNLVKDNATNTPKGYAFFEYVDPKVAEEACKELNGMALGDKSLVVQRANVGGGMMPPGPPGGMMMMPPGGMPGMRMMPGMPGGPPPGAMGGGMIPPANPTTSTLLNLAYPISAILPHLLPSNNKEDAPAKEDGDAPAKQDGDAPAKQDGDAGESAAADAAAAAASPSSAAGAEEDMQVLVLLNAMSVQELMNKLDYKDLVEDMKSELGKFGPVELLIPSPVVKPGTEEIDKENLVAGVGKVFACFHDAKTAHEACEAVGGRRFGGRTLLTQRMSKEDFLSTIKAPYEEKKAAEAQAAAASIFTMKEDTFFDEAQATAGASAPGGGGPAPPPPDEPAPWEKDEPAPWERGF